MKPSLADVLGPRLAPLDLDHRLQLVREFVPGRIVFTTSFGIEDQWITHVIFTRGLDIEVATLDTGRLFPQTYDLWERTEARYARRIAAVYPQAEPLQDWVREHGVNGFYKSVENRKACCHLRKVEPLSAAAGGRLGLDHRAARRSIRRARSVRHRRIRRRPQAAQGQSADRLQPREDRRRDGGVRRAGERTARARLSVDRLRALHARRFSPAKASARAAGGGRKTPRRNAACMSARTACCAAVPRLAESAKTGEDA